MKKISVNARVWGLLKLLEQRNKEQSTGPPPLLYPEFNIPPISYNPELLTQEQCNKIPIGTKIIVKWPGFDDLEKRTVVGRSCGNSVTDFGMHQRLLDFVGKETYHTHVFLAGE